jgi:hypothetical protein
MGSRERVTERTNVPSKKGVTIVQVLNPWKEGLMHVHPTFKWDSALRSGRPAPVTHGSTFVARSRGVYGLRTMTLGWLGTNRTPGQLVLFWSPKLVMRVRGAPPTMQVNAAVSLREGPITRPEATPSMMPG